MYLLKKFFQVQPQVVISRDNKKNDIIHSKADRIYSGDGNPSALQTPYQAVLSVNQEVSKNKKASGHTE